MQVDEARAVILSCIVAVAPETDVTLLRDEASIRDEIELDSIDFLAIVAAIHERTGYEVPDRAYPELDTLGGAIAHLVAHVPTPNR